MKKVIDAKAGTVTFSFEEASGLAPVVFNPSAVSEANRAYAMLHGFAARIGDNAAIQKSEENGYRVTEEMRRNAVLELTGHYESGSADWSPKARAAKQAPHNPHVAEIAKRLGKSYAEAEAWAAAKWLAELDALTGGEGA